MNILSGTRFFSRLSGKTYLSQNQAFEDLREDS